MRLRTHTLHANGCIRAARGGWASVTPKRRPPCAVCNTAVRGLYVWCQGCGHGGHLEHLRGWFANHTECPAGCGHQCQLRPVNESLCMPVPAVSDVPPGFRDTSIVQA